MDAIETKYHGPTNKRGSRVSARWRDFRVSVAYDSELGTIENHAAAVRKICEKAELPHRGSMTLAPGQTREGYAWVRIDTPSVIAVEREAASQ
jgi:hypothetical protein